MKTYHLEAIIAEEGVLTIQGLPLHRGETVEVIVKSQNGDEQNLERMYPLRGTPIRYHSPFDSVAEFGDSACTC